MDKKTTHDLSIAYIIVTHNRTDEAKAHMEIIRTLWQPLFKGITIYHQYNGNPDLYKNLYKEDFLHTYPAKPHVMGAADLINKGISHVLSSKVKCDYIVIASADTWVYNAMKIKNLFQSLMDKNSDIASSFWHGPFLSTEFFVITPHLARKVFPLSFEKWVRSHAFLRFISLYTIYPIFEQYFTREVKNAIDLSSALFLIPERKFVWPGNRFETKDFYLSHHNIQKRKLHLKKYLSHSIKEKNQEMPTLSQFVVSKQA